MICPNCKRQIPDGSAFCGYCGREIPQVPLCGRCGAELRPNDRFCGVCGAPVEAPADTNAADLTALEQQLAQRREEMASLRRELEEQTEALKSDREALEAERAEQARLAEEQRKAEEARLAEEKRKVEEARLAEEKRKAEEARLAEEKRKAEEARLAEEKRKAEEVRLAEEKRKAEEARLAEEKRKAEEARLAEEQRKAEEARLAEEHRKVEEAARASEAVKAAKAAKAETKTKKKQGGALVGILIALLIMALLAVAIYLGSGKSVGNALELLAVKVTMTRIEEDGEVDCGVTIQDAECRVEGTNAIFRLTCELADDRPINYFAFSPPDGEVFGVRGTITAEAPSVDIPIPVEQLLASDAMTVSMVPENSTGHRYVNFWAVKGFDTLKSKIVRYMKAQSELAETEDELPTLESTLNPGDTVTFGHYEQDYDTSNGPEAIQWRVLDVQDGKALIISDKVLACGLHRSTVWNGHDYTTWETSLIRSWMNDDFYDVAFTDTEKKAIQLTDVKDEANPYMDDIATRPNTYNWSAMEPGADTQDYVFALSVNEYEKYFSNPESAKAEATEVAKVGNPYAKDDRQRKALYTGVNRALELGFDWITMDGETWSWWLRTVGPKNISPGNFLSIVLGDGSLLEEGTCADSCDIGIRPAMWVDTSALVATITPGDTVAFGHYEQDNNTSNGAEAIQWRVLAREGNTALLISEQVLDYLPYDTNGSARWDTSSLRAELNGAFYDSAFSDEEKAVMVASSAEPYDNPVTGVKDASAATEDMVFIPSLKQANDYFQDELARVTWGTAYAVAHAREQASAQGETLAEDFGGSAKPGTDWLLRTPGQDGGTVTIARDTWYYTNEDFDRVTEGGYCFCDGDVTDYRTGVRPCIRVRIPAADTADTVGDLSSAQVGDLITIGRYEQDNDLDNGPEAIQWRVLDRKDGKLLVISDKALDCIGSCYEWRQVEKPVWATSCARGWLNNYFMQTAFTPADQARISLSNIHTDPSPGFDNDPGPDTQDYVFLLSAQETEQYFPTAESRRVLLSDYVHPHLKTRVNRQGWGTDATRIHGDWVLRSPNKDGFFAYILDHQTIYWTAGDIWYDAVGFEVDVRPAMWIEASAADISATATPEGITAVRGDTVTFGHYEQDYDTSNGPEPIQWKVLDVQGGKALLLSQDVLVRLQYHPQETGATWKDCTLRQWLNDDFYHAAFSEEELKRVCLTRNVNEDNPTYGTDGGEDTDDHVFLLSLSEAEKYFASDEERQCEFSAAVNMIVDQEPSVQKDVIPTDDPYGYGRRWWLRTPGMYPLATVIIEKDGSVSRNGNTGAYASGVACHQWNGVRPAIWIEID